MFGPTTAGARPTAALCFGHAVGRAAHARRAPVQDVGVNLRGGHVPVPEQLLDGPDVVVLLQKMCREGVAQRVGCAALGDAGLPSGCSASDSGAARSTRSAIVWRTEESPRSGCAVFGLERSPPTSAHGSLKLNRMRSTVAPGAMSTRPLPPCSRRRRT